MAGPPSRSAWTIPTKIRGSRWRPTTRSVHLPLDLAGDPAASVHAATPRDGLPSGCGSWAGAGRRRAARRRRLERIAPWADKSRGAGLGPRRPVMKTDDVKRILVVGAARWGQIAVQSACTATPSLSRPDDGCAAEGMGQPQAARAAGAEGPVAKDQMEEAMTGAARARWRRPPRRRLRHRGHRGGPGAQARVLRRARPLLPPHAILATTSTLMNSQIASAAKRPDKCVNMHYFYRR